MKKQKIAVIAGDAKRRGLSAERMAEIRALRGIKKAAETPETPAAPAAKAPKTAKAAKTKTAAPAAENGAAPKRRGLSAERMAEIRAMKGTKKSVETPETPAAPAVKAPKAVKAAKTKAAAPAAADGTAPKRRGLSAERMAEIRAMKGKKKED